ncbi:MAG: YraN family protein [Treponema sp.]|nr:YraN family protein [Treponema sp.]
MTSKVTGNDGEKRAADFLIQNGYKIIDRNWRTKSGEIDIIVMKDEVLVFVEVKTLPNATFDMLSSVLGMQKQKRIVKTAKHFMLKHRQYSNSYIRFDVIVLDMQGLPPVYHIENAFTE